MLADDAVFTLRLARDARDLRAAQRLRYGVFVSELGGDGPLVSQSITISTLLGMLAIPLWLNASRFI